MSDYANDWVGQTLSGGRYRVDAKLGEGGMGFVYKVWDRNLDTDVVVKAPRKSMLDDPEFASRFALEIRSLVKLSHPNIVKVSDVGEHEGLPFAVMQYLSGGTLDERLDYGRDGRPLPAPPSTVSGWLPGMAAALDFIHGKGYIHRDVKPANILFDSHGHPYLSDFGVAKVLSDVEAVTSKKGHSGLTGAGIVLGTPDYMAPELIMGNSFDGKVDQYALAATAYEILCGRKPFKGDTATAVLVRQTTQAPPPMAELPAAAAEAISRVILKALAKKPGDRFGTCVEFANALLPALAKAGAARPPVDRLTCPACGVGFAIPDSLASYKGKKSKCRACGSPFRIAEDGLSLLRVDPEAIPTATGSVELPFSDRQSSLAASAAARANRTTMKLDAMPGPDPAASPRTEKLDAMPAPAPARVERTMKLDAMPGPSRVERTMKLEAMPGPPPDGLAPEARARGTMKLEAMTPAVVGPDESPALRDDEPEARSILPWVIGAVGASAALVILVIALAMRPAKEPAVELASGLTPIHVPPPPPKSRTPIAKAPTPAPLPPSIAPGPATAIQGPTPPPMPAPMPPAPVEGEKLSIQPPDKPDPEVPAEVEKHDDPPARPLPRPGQAMKVHLTLREIVGDPKDHIDQLVCPADLLLVNTNAGNRAAPRELSVSSKEGAYHAFEKPGSSFRIVLKPELLNQLQGQINGNVLVEGNYPTMMGMKVVGDPRNPGGYLGLVEWLEFLYYIDPRPISGRSRIYKDVYSVVHLSTEGPSVGRSRNFKQWQERIQKPTTTIRNQYDIAGKPPIYNEWGKQAMNPAGHAAFFHKAIMGHFR